MERFMDNFLILAYHTTDKLYSDYADRLKRSLELFNLPYHIFPISSKGNWNNNTSYKPSFLYDMLIHYKGKHIVYVDADAEFKQAPSLFYGLENTCKTIGVHYLNHKLHKGINRPVELLSGTIYFNNNEETLDIVKKWKEICIKNPSLWDQKALYQVIGNGAYNLPEEYCYIFDYKYNRKIEPVIVHYQASRKARRTTTINA